MDQSVIVPSSSSKVLPNYLRHLRPAVVDDLIRLGIGLDGGYVLPRSAVIAADALLSFGLGMDWSFERDAVQLNPNLLVHVYDNSITDRTFLDMIVTAWNNFRRAQGSLSEVRAFVELYESYHRFFQGNVVHIRERVFDRKTDPDDTTLEEVLARLTEHSQLLVKMDIEGGEYRIMDSLLAHEQRIRAIVVEFHATEFQREIFLKTIGQITRYYTIVHLHGNNAVGPASDGLPDVLEITFLRKDLCTSSSYRDRVPVAGLDFPNIPAKPEYELVFDESRYDSR